MAWERGEADVGLRSIAVGRDFAHSEEPEKRMGGVVMLQFERAGICTGQILYSRLNASAGTTCLLIASPAIQQSFLLFPVSILDETS